MTSKQSTDQLLRYPDDTVLQLPNRTRATVAALRKLSDARRLERDRMLEIEPPASIAIHFTGADASRSRYESALLAAGAMVPPAPSNPTPAPCVNGRSSIGRVNGKSSDIAFVPSGTYRIVGCGFGSGGIVAIAASSDNGPLTLTPTKWTNTEIDATLPSSITGVPDQSNVTISVTPSGGSPIQQAGHAFIAAREDVLVGKLDTSYWQFSKGPYEPAGFGHSTAGVTNGSVTFAKILAGRCDLDATRADVFSIASMPLAPGFGVENIVVTNTVSQLVMDNVDVTEVLSSPFSVSALGDDAVEIHYQLNATYRKHASAVTKGFQGLVQGPLPFFAALREGTSACSGGYDISVTVTGPRGIAPLTR